MDGVKFQDGSDFQDGLTSGGEAGVDGVKFQDGSLEMRAIIKAGGLLADEVIGDHAGHLHRLAIEFRRCESRVSCSLH